MTRVTVYVENRGDEGLARVLLAGQSVTIENSMTESGALSDAEYHLGHRPHEPVALLLGTRGRDPP